MNQLATLETMNPLEIFNSGNLDSILHKISEDVKSQRIDISTEKGRKEVASLAYKVARSKTFLDDLGKKLGEEARLKLNAINSERKKSNDFLDALKDEIRKPLTEWENVEKKRVATHEAEISEIIDAGKTVEVGWQNLTTEFIQGKIFLVESASDRDWQEFKSRADSEISSSLNKLNGALISLQKYQQEQAELAKFRAAEALRIQKEREEKIAAEAAERARVAAEQKAKVEADRVAREAEIEKQKAIRAARESEEKAKVALREKEMLEKKAKEDALRASREKEQAVENERRRAEQARLAAEEAERVRERNKRHSAKINNEVLSCIVSLGVSESLAKSIVIAISSGKVPHTKINY